MTIIRETTGVVVRMSLASLKDLGQYLKQVTGEENPSLTSSREYHLQSRGGKSASVLLLGPLDISPTTLDDIFML